MKRHLLILTNLPDQASAGQLATALVERHLAACVNVLAPCHSVYRWRGKLETATEILLLVKTSAERYAEVEAVIRARHPYELPEIVAFPIECGLPGYLDWITRETEPSCEA
ncbi:MAG: divalent-cation tolerance protein CutA [Zoogloeaceae bacterium]|nr:divalent-cation tolerance protein CutA [Zoogloeaceae bacterium]